MSLFAYVLTRIRVFFDAFTRFAYARFLRIFWFAYLRAALYIYTYVYIMEVSEDLAEKAIGLP